MTLTGLHPGQVYQFRVRAYNAVGCQYRNTAVLRPFRSGQRHGAILRPKIFVLIQLDKKYSRFAGFLLLLIYPIPPQFMEIHYFIFLSYSISIVIR